MKPRTRRTAKTRVITRAEARRDPLIAEALLTLGAIDPRELLLSEIAASHVERVLDACRGNVSLAAALLGINRRSLQRWMGGAAKR